jgi:hypothetical protein
MRTKRAHKIKLQLDSADQAQFNTRFNKPLVWRV